jgi:alkanesulfonate monooxygenase SsuD/methylene tetrahydromethanopterin reductase-like flavin-dependent oxidoreductase (luciferase family)
MLVGLQTPEVERPFSWKEVRDVARAAEACGLDSVWVGDHLLYRDGDGSARGPFEAWSVLAALAEATERVLIGPFVAATAFHAPAMLAKTAATVDDISGGRLILGLGAGWNRVEFDAFGFPFDRRVDRFEEAFTIIRELIRNGQVDFSGKYHTVREAELVPRARPDIPFMVGSNGRRVLRITAAHVQMWNTWHTHFGNRPSGLPPLLAEVDAACEDAGRPPAEVERTVALYVQAPGGKGRAAGSDERPTVEPVPVAGVTETLDELAGLGVGHVQVVLDPIDPVSVEKLAAHLGRV